VKFRIAVFVFALPVPGAPAVAADESGAFEPVPMRALAPADEYFGRARLSVLGVANIIRDSGARLDEGAVPPSMVDGPLSFVDDAIRDWERQFPRDPWIARDLYALELTYLRVRAPLGTALARKTATWLCKDYPDSPFVRDARLALGDVIDGENTPADAWSRFASLRAPLRHRTDGRKLANEDVRSGCVRQRSMRRGAGGGGGRDAAGRAFGEPGGPVRPP